MPLEVHPHPSYQTASRYQFDFSHPSLLEERSRRSPELWRMQPTRTGFSFTHHDQPLARSRSAYTEVTSRDLKETDDPGLNMTGSYGGYSATLHNAPYALPIADYTNLKGSTSIAYSAQTQFQPTSQASSRNVSRPASPVFPPVETNFKSRNSIVSYLQIPSSISSTRGSLAEFAAQVRSN